MGNPNSGKTTLFNALTGMHHKVANYPGVTVERREARLAAAGDSLTLIDLPGLYSLIPRSADECIARDALLGLLSDVDPVDAALIVVDAGNLQRNLQLATQIIDLGIPAVLCCNMMDAAVRHGDRLDTARLSALLGVAVVGTIGNRRSGIHELKQVLADRDLRIGQRLPWELPAAIGAEVDELHEPVRALSAACRHHDRLAALMLAGGANFAEHRDGAARLIHEAVGQARGRLRNAGIRDPESAIFQCRYQAVRNLVAAVTAAHAAPEARRTDRVDRLLTHPLSGTAIFSALMFVMFLSIFSGAEPLMDLMEGGLRFLGDRLAAGLPAGLLRSLLIDGVIAGVGAVVVFVPQICILFLFICLLEDTGYMARAALLMHRLMSKVGLPGKSFIPLLSSFACAIPGIMAARTIEQRRDRFVTILIAPFMSCSARLPVYVILIGAVFSGSIWLQSGIMLSMYLLGIAAALGTAFVLKRTVFKGPQPGFLIELPPYRRPSLRVILRTMWQRSVLFLKDAGTLIFAVSILLWALASFPRADAASARNDPGLQLRQSFMGRIGKWMEPAIEPLGFDWKIGIGLTASFAAREVFVSTMGIVYGVGSEADEASEPLRNHLAADTWPDGRKVYTPASGISLMVFYVLACQCASTLGVVRRETNSWRWPVFMFVYMSGLAYGGSLGTYQALAALGWAGQ